MHQPAATQSATAPQSITLSDGETIDAQEFSDHIARMLTATATTGPSAAALWFASQNRRT
jgi:hypothetical protein